MIYLIIITILLFSAFGTYLIRKIAVHKNIIDIPNSRSSHTVATPRGGGLAIVLAWYLGLIGLKYLDQINSHLYYALLSGSILAVAGLLDDLFSLKPWIRMLFQILAVTAGLYFINGFNSVYLGSHEIFSPILLTIIAFIGSVWFINLYNFLDGIDGYASVEAILVAIGMYMVINDPIFLILIVSVLGFLIWNWPKAKIFMGDVGSTQLGYILVILGIYFNNNKELNIFGWLTLTSLFWVDATLTLLRRWRNQEKLSVAHKKHAYQRIVQFGFTHKKTIIISIFINLFFILFVLVSERYYIVYIFLIPICIISNYLIIKYIDSKVPFCKNDLSKEL
jgi:UDP-N-acetylmuramyl pentapeptide phosphotransferase/UDP-N-acetylglucosamine-1-phosphate transferase